MKWKTFFLKFLILNTKGEGSNWPWLCIHALFIEDTNGPEPVEEGQLAAPEAAEEETENDMEDP